MKVLEAKHIKKSTELMEEFEVGDYDFLELRDWLQVVESSKSKFSVYDNSDCFNISIMISKTRNPEKTLFPYSPTMTEFRQTHRHSIYLDSEYPEDAFYSLIQKACMKWKKDVYIELEKEVCLRAQTMENRTDYGCEWLGGGDWVEKTMYGETTNFFITGIILREPYKFIQQEATEILESLQDKYAEFKEHIDRSVRAFKNTEVAVFSNKYGEGRFSRFVDNTVEIQFSDKSVSFHFPECVLKGFIQIPKYEKLIYELSDYAIELESIQKEMKAIEMALEPENYSMLHELMYRKYKK